MNFTWLPVKTLWRLVILLALLLIPLAASAQEGGDVFLPLVTSDGSTQAPPVNPPEATVALVPEGEQQMLVIGAGVDFAGAPLYRFASDSEGARSSACTGGCATAWPPFTVEAAADLTADAELMADLSLFEREDGALQVAFAGWPLHRQSTGQSGSVERVENPLWQRVALPTLIPADPELGDVEMLAQPTAPRLFDFGEAGWLELGQPDARTWQTIELAQSYSDPLVFLGIPSLNGGQPTTLRVRNVTSTSFEVQLDEWDYLDGFHVIETFDYFVVEAGTHSLGGLTIEATATELSETWSRLDFSNSFEATPVVLPQIQHVNGSNALTVRQRSANSGGVELRLQSEEAVSLNSASETVGVLAVQFGAVGDVEARRVEGVTDANYWILFDNQYEQSLLFGSIETFNGADPATLRYRNLFQDGATIFVQEEQSRDKERFHTTEGVGYLVIDGAPGAGSTEPTAEPTAEPTDAPTVEPTAAPTSAPTAAPTSAPTAAPTSAPTAAPTPAPTQGPSTGSYEQNLQLIQNVSVRNTNHDGSPYRDVPQAELVIENHLGPRSDYLEIPDGVGHPEQSFPVDEGGQFRVACEFSHFAYDDPLVYPNQPGASHLHMFWGNTDANAYSTYESLRDSGSSTCNGQELNRTGYWAPAMIDAEGNARIPERIIVYYKGYGLAKERAEVYPPGAAMISRNEVHKASWNEGGTAPPAGSSEQTSEFSFHCADMFRGARENYSETIPVCDGSKFNPDWRVTLEMHVKFPNCWNREDPSNLDNWGLARIGGWFYSECEERATFPNIEYLIIYPLEYGETTEGWYLASDVNPVSRVLDKAPGTTVHADWWGGWHPEINQQWIDNCTTYSTDQPSGCGFGYLTDGGPDNQNPYPGPALKFRPQYEGPIKVPAAALFEELCPANGTAGSAAEAAYCTPTPPSALASLAAQNVCRADAFDVVAKPE